MVGMRDVCIFFNTRVENAGTLSQIGDLGLAPMRYLCGGKTIHLETAGQTVTIHSVASFHKDGNSHTSISTYNLKSSPTHMLKAIASVLVVVPGLFLAVVKLVDYAASAEARKNHRLVREHLTPINREIGTPHIPIRTYEQLSAALAKAWQEDSMNRPTNALIIHAFGNVELNTDPGILRFNPMKLILEGAQIVHKPCSSPWGCLDERMLAARIWETGSGWRIATNANPHTSVVAIRETFTIAQALEVPLLRRGRLTCKCFHQVFVIPRPIAEAST
jgi:hypothetical protein